MAQKAEDNMKDVILLENQSTVDYLLGSRNHPIHANYDSAD